MPDPKPGRWLQLHLSTCAVLMLVACVGVWINSRPEFSAHEFTGEPDALLYGWPSLFGVSIVRGPIEVISWKGFFMDAAIVLFAILVAAVGSEWLIRRRPSVAIAPPRRFQLHLSTLILMMLVAGVLVWANTCLGQRWAAYAYDKWEPGRCRELGWPFFCGIVVERGTQTRVEGIHYEWAAVNALVGVVVLLSAGVLIEYLIRRRERQQP
jgi:hypothetical protein